MIILQLKRHNNFISEKKVLVNRLIADIRMKSNPAKDIIQINGKLLKFIFMLFKLLANKPEIKITNIYNPQKQKVLLDFLLNKFDFKDIVL